MLLQMIPDSSAIIHSLLRVINQLLLIFSCIMTNASSKFKCRLQNLFSCLFAQLSLALLFSYRRFPLLHQQHHITPSLKS